MRGEGIVARRAFRRASRARRTARRLAARRIYDQCAARSTRRLGRYFNDLAFRANPFRGLNKRLVLACSARTGSHLLMEGLLSHGAYVDEHFNFEHIDKVVDLRGITLEKYCGDLLTRCAIGGVFGVKGPPYVIAPLVLAGEIPAFLSQWRFVFLTRENAVREAISGVIAGITEAWQSFQPARRVVTDADFDAEAITAMMERKRRINTEWEAIFTTLRIAPLRLTYEQLAADREGTVARAADFLDLHDPPITDARFVTPPVEIQSTDLNLRWEGRYRRGLTARR